MGNKFCFCILDKNQEYDHDNIKLKQLLIILNQKFTQSLKQVPQITAQIMYFHNEVLSKLICISPIFSMKMGIKPKQDKKQVHLSGTTKAYYFIKKDIMSQPLSGFMGVINCYFNFLLQTLEISSNQLTFMNGYSHSKDQEFNSAQEVFNSNSPYPKIQTQQISAVIQQDYQQSSTMFSSVNERTCMKEQVLKHLKKLFRSFRNPSEVACVLLNQLDFILKILRLFTDTNYQTIFMSHIGDKIDYFQEKEICVERIIQHFLLSKNHPLSYILPFLTEIYYNGVDEGYQRETRSINQGESNFVHSQELTRTEPILDKTLRPQSLANYSHESSLERDSLDDSSFYLKQDSADLHFPQKTQTLFNSQPEVNQKSRLLAMIATTVEVVTNQQVPYSQTFTMIMRIIKARKFWKKFKLIEKLDQQIVFLFMRKRSESQFNKFYDTISAEDSKSEILFFILYSFHQAHPKIQLTSSLYLPLRLMHEFDGCLHSDLKFVFCPHFLRFFNILEMLIHSELCV